MASRAVSAPASATGSRASSSARFIRPVSGSCAARRASSSVEVAEDELAELTARERAAGQPDFAPKLSGDGPLHAVVAHRWPADEGVTGFDLSGDPVRWGALQQARDQGMATVISAPTTVTEDGFEVTQRASIQVYQPLYQIGRAHV